jgi:hypothetical protein
MRVGSPLARFQGWRPTQVSWHLPLLFVHRGQRVNLAFLSSDVPVIFFVISSPIFSASPFPRAIVASRPVTGSTAVRLLSKRSVVWLRPASLGATPYQISRLAKLGRVRFKVMRRKLAI